jgi:hypothetical protein
MLSTFLSMYSNVSSTYVTFERQSDNLQIVEAKIGVRSSVVIKALCYKAEGRGFDTR